MWKMYFVDVHILFYVTVVDVNELVFVVVVDVDAPGEEKTGVEKAVMGDVDVFIDLSNTFL